MASAMQAVPLLHHIHRDLARFASHRAPREGTFLIHSAANSYPAVLIGQHTSSCNVFLICCLQFNQISKYAVVALQYCTFVYTMLIVNNRMHLKI